MKKYLCIILGLLCALDFLVSINAATPGTPLGWVLHSDIVAYIDGYPICSYNINGNTYIVAEDLIRYGFNVEWLAREEKLIIHTDRTAPAERYAVDYIPEPSRYPAGIRAMQYLYTSITVWIGAAQIVGYNIGGYTCVAMDDLAEFFADSYVWDAETRELRMTSRSRNFIWNQRYLTPNYNVLETVEGEYAIWEFVKNADGVFELVYSEGDTNFTSSIHFGADYMWYSRVLTIEGRDENGEAIYRQAPHTLWAHTQSEFLTKSYDGSAKVYRLPGDETMIFPEDFADYCVNAPQKAEYFRELSRSLRKNLRVYYNGEVVDLIGLIEPHYQTQSDRSEKTYNKFYLQFGRAYALEDVTHVRIEFQVPAEK